MIMTKKIGRFRLKEGAIGEKYGFFADVTVELELGETPLARNPEIVYGEFSWLVPDVDWRVATAFGARYAIRQMAECRNIERIRVVDVYGMIADTTEPVIAYATAMAVWDALSYVPPRPPKIDRENGLIMFSK